MTEEEKTALRAEIRAIIEKQQKAAEENTKVLALVQKNVDDNGKVAEGTKDAVAAMTKEAQTLAARLLDTEQKLAKIQATPPKAERALSVGEQFTAVPDFKLWAEGMANSGKRGNFSHSLKTITSIGASAGAGIFPDVIPGVIQEPLRRLTIRDLLDKGTTTSNSIEWVQELLFTNNADVVSEGTLKPESNITYELKTVLVRTIAHWIRASKQVLADFPLLETMINGRLTLGLKIKEEDLLLYGDGVQQNLLGLVPQATDYNTALNVSGDTMLDVIRHAILQVRLAHYPASGVVVSPVDWHYMELTKDNENRYIMASPTGRLPPAVWGLPVVDADAMNRGEFLVGAFNIAATILDRMLATILVSTEDQDNFVKNLVTILAEERLALAVTRPASFVHGAFPAGSTT